TPASGREPARNGASDAGCPHPTAYLSRSVGSRTEGCQAEEKRGGGRSTDSANAGMRRGFSKPGYCLAAGGRPLSDFAVETTMSVTPHADCCWKRLRSLPPAARLESRTVNFFVGE